MPWFFSQKHRWTPSTDDPLVRLTRQAYSPGEAGENDVDLQQQVRRVVREIERDRQRTDNAGLPFWQRATAQAGAALTVVLILTVWTFLPSGGHRMGPAPSAAGIHEEFRRALALYDQAALAVGGARSSLLEQSGAAFAELSRRYPDERSYGAAALLFLADCEMELGHWAQGEAAYGRVLEQFADDSTACRQARLALAEYHVTQEKRPERAEPHIHALALEGASEAAPLCLALALCLEATAPERAMVWLDRAVALAGDASAVGNDAQAARTRLEERLRERSYIKDWWLIGPFSNADNALLAHAEPPEREFQSGAKYPGKSGLVGWVRPYAPTDWGPVNLLEVFGNQEEAAAYAVTWIHSPVEREVLLSLGSDDGIRVWLNDDLVWQNPRERHLIPDQDVVRVHLIQGYNTVRLKVANNKGEWGFSFRVLSTDGKPLFDLQVDPLWGARAPKSAQ